MSTTNDTKNETDQAGTAMTVDPAITWLEQIRDFMGTTPQSKDMAQRVLDRLRPPAPDVWAIVGALVDEMGDWRKSFCGALVSDRPHHPAASADDAGYYGGYLVAESIAPRYAAAMQFLPQLLVAARDTPNGRAILAQLATALRASVPHREAVRDRLDGTLRLARLGQEFSAGAGDVEGEMYAVSVILGHLAAGLLEGKVPAAIADIEAWLDGKREARKAARTGATS